MNGAGDVDHLALGMTDANTSSQRHWPASAFHELLNRPAKQLPALDGLRAIAVLLVICGHWVFEWTTIAHYTDPWISRLPMFYWGWTGVDLFFVLSGFLIGKQLWSELYRTDTINVSQFILRRGLRIWPLYFAWIVFLVAVGSSKAPSWPDWVMLSNYFHSRYDRSWSLSSEEQFYVIMPTLLLLMQRFIARRWWPACVLALAASIPVFREITFRDLTAQGIASPEALTLMYPPLHLHCEPLLAGLMVAWISLRKPAWLAPRDEGRVALRVLGVGALIAISGMLLRALNRQAFAYIALGSVYGSALAIALADRSWVTAVLRWRAWYPIARLSFGMYLNHLILREPTDTIIAFVGPALGEDSLLAFLAGLVLTVCGSAAMAAISFVLVEHPGLALRDRWLARRRSPQVA